MNMFLLNVLTVIALLLVIEGIMPFLVPSSYRKLMLHISNSSDRSLRIAGLISMLCGALLMYLIHSNIIF